MKTSTLLPALRVAERPPGRFKLSVMKWLGVPISLKDGAFWGAYYTDANGNIVTPDSALQISTVWACVRLISQAIATMPLFVYEKGEGLKRRLATEHPLYELLHTMPNKNSTAVVFWESVAAALLLRGAAYIEIRSIGSTIKGLVFLDPDRLERRLDDGVYKYRFRELDSTVRDIPRERLMIVPGFGTDGETGLSVIQYGAKVFGNATAANSSSSKLMGNGMRATGFITTEMILKPQNRDLLKASLQDFATGDSVGGTMILEGGMTYHPVTMKPEDVQLLETRSFNVEEIARWFAVPPHMIGHTGGSTSWGTGIEQQTIGFVKFCLAPWLKRIEQEITKSLIDAEERSRFYAEFALEGLLRGDSKARSELYASAVQNGWMTRREVRDLENLPAIEGDDILTVQVNLTPIDQLGSAPDPVKAAAENLARAVNDQSKGTEA